MTSTPHDALFKAAFSHPPRAAEALRHSLPPALAAAIDFSTLTLLSGSQVDDDLRAHHTDLLFAATLAGQDARIYVLFEHQSRPDRWMPVRLLGYMVRIWEGAIAETPAALRLPPIVPVVLHHSDAGWRAAPRLAPLFDLPATPDLRAHVPDFQFLVDDLGLATSEDILRRAGSAFTRLVLAALQQVRPAPDLAALLRGWARLLAQLRDEPDAEQARRLVFSYIYEVRGAAEYSDAVAATVHQLDRESEATMETIAQMLRREGRQEGRREGRQEGRQEGLREGLREGQRELLLRMLQARFGELSPGARARIDAAAPADLQVWADRFVVARSLDEVFTP